MRILFIGDIVASSGRNFLRDRLASIKLQYNIDFIIANGENASHGKGISATTYSELIRYGIQAMTLGNHFITKMENDEFYTIADRLIRPYNLDQSAPGVGTRVFKTSWGPIRVTNLLGRVFMTNPQPDNPFDALDDILMDAEEKIHIVDFHAETTGEKYALGFAFDGRVTAVLGTHTHIQTTDNRLLPEGTAFISDVGMTGPYLSIIGAHPSEVVYRTRTNLPARFEVADGPAVFSAVIIDVNEETGRAKSIDRIQLIP